MGRGKTVTEEGGEETTNPSKWEGGAEHQHSDKDSKIKYTSLCGRFLSSERCEGGAGYVADTGGGSYPGFGMMSPRDHGGAWPPFNWPRLFGREPGRGGGVRGGQVAWSCGWRSSGEGGGEPSRSHAAALCLPPQHLHSTPQWWQARRGR